MTAATGATGLRSSRGAPPAWSLAVSAMVLIQLGNALSVGLIEQLGAAGTAWLRLAMGAVILLALVRPSLRAVRRGDLPLLLALGAATGAMVVAFLSAVERIPLGTAVAIEFLGPLTVAGIAGKRLKTLIWPLLAFAGVVVLTEPWHGEIDLVGVGFALLAGACWGLYNVFTQVVGDRFSGITGLSLTIPIAAIATAPVGLPQVIDGNLVWWVLPLAVGVALITPVVSFALEMIALRRMTHTAFGTLMSLEPALGVLLGLILLAQQPALAQLIGIVLVVVAGAGAQLEGARESVEVASPVHGPMPDPEPAVGALEQASAPAADGSQPGPDFDASAAQPAPEERSTDER